MRRLFSALILFIFFLSFVNSEVPAFDQAPHKKVSQMPRTLKNNVKNNPAYYIDDLAAYLAEGVTDDFELAKILHDWVTLNIAYDAKGYYGKSKIVYSPLDVIKTGRSVCSGYANVFKILCDKVGLEAVIISGYGRGAGFSPMKSTEKYDANHAWNGVKIYGEWYLVDATWDAGYINGTKFNWSYGTGYFLTPPEHFIYTHFPAENQWQLLESPIPFETFRTFPYYRDRFFNYKMEPPEGLKMFEEVSNHAEINIKAPENVIAMATVYNSRGKKVKERAFVQRDGDTLNIKLTFPGKDRYKVSLFVKHKGDKTSYWEAAQFYYKTQKGTTKYFPLTYSPFFNFGAVINAPVLSPLELGDTVYFDVIIPGSRTIGVNDGKNFINLTPDGTGRYTGDITVRGKAVYLYYKDGNYKYIAKWSAK